MVYTLTIWSSKIYSLKYQSLQQQDAKINNLTQKRRIEDDFQTQVMILNSSINIKHNNCTEYKIQSSYLVWTTQCRVDPCTFIKQMYPGKITVDFLATVKLFSSYQHQIGIKHCCPVQEFIGNWTNRVRGDQGFD